MHVISAGYGLYPVEAMVTSYAATFVPGHADSVPPERVAARDRVEYLAGWWAAIAEQVEIDGVTSRSFLQLALEDPHRRVLVVAGGNYLDAITEDLLLAREHLSNSDHLAVVSAGASERALGILGENVLPVDARFENLVMGARTALNARVAHWLLSEVVDPSKVGAAYFRRKLELKASELPPARKFERETMSDKEIQLWIIQNLDRPEAASASSLLRYLRDNGMACEQKRFGVLYRSANHAGKDGMRGK
jgi:hypothetical protein